MRAVHEMMLQKVNNYTMKLRLYPSAAQKEIIEKMFRALHLAYNITFHEVFQKNPAICRQDQKSGHIYPDFNKMANSSWSAYLIAQNPAIKDAPAISRTGKQGLFILDAQKAWPKTQNGKSKAIDFCSRTDFHFYHSGHPRRSFYVQVNPKNLASSPDNEKVMWVTLPKIKGRIKARGVNARLRFGENGQYTYAEALDAGFIHNNLSVRVSRDTCGDYFICITFGESTLPHLLVPAPDHQEPIGIDVGIKDIAILSTGQKVENKHFQKRKEKTISRLQRKLSRRWGPANMAYRDYNKAIRQDNRNAAEDCQQPLAQPSHRYLRTQRKKALIERRITRQRSTYYHQQTAAIVRQSSVIAVETLHVRNMLRNHKLAHALSDAAMSDFLSMVKYKAERFDVPLYRIGMFEPSSQLCSVCGEQNPAVKRLGVRFWQCPHCGTYHDRDVNAARNILQIGLLRGLTDAEKEPSVPDEKPPAKRTPRRSPLCILPDSPHIVVVYSKELTRPNNPRYVIKDTNTGTIIDNAQGAGYRSISNARNCYKAKKRWGQPPVLSPA